MCNLKSPFVQDKLRALERDSGFIALGGVLSVRRGKEPFILDIDPRSLDSFFLSCAGDQGLNQLMIKELEALKRQHNQNKKDIMDLKGVYKEEANRGKRRAYKEKIKSLFLERVKIATKIATYEWLAKFTYKTLEAPSMEEGVDFQGLFGLDRGRIEKHKVSSRKLEFLGAILKYNAKISETERINLDEIHRRMLRSKGGSLQNLLPKGVAEYLESQGFEIQECQKILGYVPIMSLVEYKEFEKITKLSFLANTMVQLYGDNAPQELKDLHANLRLGRKNINKLEKTILEIADYRIGDVVMDISSSCHKLFTDMKIKGLSDLWEYIMDVAFQFFFSHKHVGLVIGYSTRGADISEMFYEYSSTRSLDLSGVIRSETFRINPVKLISIPSDELEAIDRLNNVYTALVKTLDRDDITFIIQQLEEEIPDLFAQIDKSKIKEICKGKVDGMGEILLDQETIEHKIFAKMLEASYQNTFHQECYYHDEDMVLENSDKRQKRIGIVDRLLPFRAKKHDTTRSFAEKVRAGRTETEDLLTHQGANIICSEFAAKNIVKSLVIFERQLGGQELGDIMRLPFTLDQSLEMDPAKLAKRLLKSQAIEPVDLDMQHTLSSFFGSHSSVFSR